LNKHYCAIIIDGSPRKPLARLFFNSAQKSITLFDEEKNEEKIAINSIEDIYNYSDKLKAAAKYYDMQKPQDATGKSLKSFTFKGKKHETKYWKDMLLQLCGIVAELNTERFDKILEISGRQRPFFSKNPKELRSANQIPGSDIYAEVNLSADSIIRLSKSVISKFEYPETDLSIETL
jgi:hypothetical protein